MTARPPAARAVALVLVCIAAPAVAHPRSTSQVTYSREVVRILRQRCLPCHGDGGEAMPLTRYAQARPWARAIRDEVLARRMPPWPPHPAFGEFADDGSLSTHAAALLVAWADGGAPEGDPRDLPEGDPPPPPARGPLPGAATVRVRSALTLAPGSTVLALCAEARRGAPVEVYLVARDGGRRPLLWIPAFDPARPYTYRLRAPIVAAPGDRVEVRGRGAAVQLTVSAPAGSPPSPAPAP